MLSALLTQARDSVWRLIYRQPHRQPHQNKFIKTTSSKQLHQKKTSSKKTSSSKTLSTTLSLHFVFNLIPDKTYLCCSCCFSVYSSSVCHKQHEYTSNGNDNKNKSATVVVATVALSNATFISLLHFLLLPLNFVFSSSSNRFISLDVVNKFAHCCH